MIILMRLLGRFFEMAYEFQAYAARIRTLPWKIFLAMYARNTRATFSSPRHVDPHFYPGFRPFREQLRKIDFY